MIGPYMLGFLTDKIAAAMAELPAHSYARAGLEAVRKELLREAAQPVHVPILAPTAEDAP